MEERFCDWFQRLGNIMKFRRGKTAHPEILAILVVEQTAIHLVTRRLAASTDYYGRT